MRAPALRNLPLTLLLLSATGPAGADSTDLLPRARTLSVGCVGCHGVSGHGGGSIPKISGRAESAFLRQMQEFRAGKPGATVMNRIAPAYSEEEYALLARFFSRP